MESEIRKKFVIVTISLMTLVLGICYLGMHFYYRYWFDQDTLQFLEWIADSGILQTDAENVPVDTTNSHIDPEFAIAVVVIQEDKVISEKFIGADNQQHIPKEVIDCILIADKDDYKAYSYIYTLRKLSDNRTLIILTDSEYNSTRPTRLLSRILLILLGISLMTTIIFLLSKFVTKPAIKAMLREKQFVSDASHELKTPLGAISINAQALLGSSEKLFSEKADPNVPLAETKHNYERHIQNIIRESQRMNRLVEKLLMLSKIEEKKVRKKTQISLSSCVEEMALTYESVAYEKGIHYDYQIAEDITINGNEDEIKQLIAILIDNAIKHTPKDGIVLTTLQQKKDRILLIVEDTGDGISAEDLPHIFERFYKADVSRKSSSFGLGLAIAKAIAERHNAHISAESTPGKKTIFEVEF